MNVGDANARRCHAHELPFAKAARDVATHAAAQVGTRSQCDEGHALRLEIVLRLLLRPEVRDVAGEIALENAGEYEPWQGGAFRGIDEIAIALEVCLERIALLAVRIPNRARDNGVHTEHRWIERSWIEHVAAHDLHTLCLELSRVRSRAHERAHALAARKKLPHDATAEVSSGPNHQHGAGHGTTIGVLFRSAWMKAGMSSAESR